MNFQEFCDLVVHTPRPQGMREGQHWSYRLHRLSPLASSRVPSELDPFYEDELLQDFIGYLGSNWTALTTPLYSRKAPKAV